jgi:serine protease Do
MLRNMTASVLAVLVWTLAPPTVGAQYSRVTPLVKVVQKGGPSVVAIYPNKDRKAIGSGIIVDKRGLIVTNNHVVGQHQDVLVVLHDGTNVDGKVIHKRPDLDLAFVRVRTDKALPAIAPKQDELLLGESVVAIGHPYGYLSTVSQGIVSALNREIVMPNGFTVKKLIQTDAMINPGNSGGPLFNINGELIGINCAVLQSAAGIAFSVHSLTVLEALKEAEAKLAD